ncbi:MAG: transposase, partial [Myxococcales bacterium]|nr:transposase [Myxococcales bacterium]
VWCAAFVDWYNNEHRHSAIGYVTPSQRHDGEGDEILAKRRCVYEQASGSTQNDGRAAPGLVLHTEPSNAGQHGPQKTGDQSMMLASEMPPRLLLSWAYRRSLRVSVRQSSPRNRRGHTSRLCSVTWAYSITQKGNGLAKLKLSEDHSGSNP